jgi:hypothetical protein
MALSESGLGSIGPMVIQGANGKRITVRPKKGPAKGSTTVRGGRKQNFYVSKGKGRRK